MNSRQALAVCVSPGARYALRGFELAFPAVLAQGGVDIVPGAQEALATLRQAGRRVCLMSRLPKPCIEAIVDTLGWRGLIDLTVAPTSSSRTPPHPDLVLSAIMQLADVTRVSSSSVSRTPTWCTPSKKPRLLDLVSTRVDAA